MIGAGFGFRPLDLTDVAEIAAVALCNAGILGCDVGFSILLGVLAAPPVLFRLFDDEDWASGGGRPG